MGERPGPDKNVKIIGKILGNQRRDADHERICLTFKLR